MKLKMYLYILFIAMLIISCSQKQIRLNDFIFEPQYIPNECSIVKPTANEPLPFNIPDNPCVSSDTSFTKLAALLLETDELNSTIKTALFSVYQCKNEIGINGIEFENVTDAKKCELILNKLETDTLRFNVFRNKNIVIHLWRDDIIDSCYYDFEKLIKDRLNL